MECSKCHKIKKFCEFSFKNIEEKIYYLYCDDCRNKTIEEQFKYREKAYEEYNMKKINNKITCECGCSYVCFREFHMFRHINSKKHKKLIKEKYNIVE